MLWVSCHSRTWAPVRAPCTAIRSAHGPAASLYRRRRPEKTTLYQVVREHVETFFLQVERETGAGLPQFVKDEFDAFLRCALLVHGFLRLRCSACAKDTLAAFSCKRRGFCPACGARRMAETAAHLLDHVIPHVPVRQWVLSFPIPLRHLFATQPHLLSPVLQVITRALSTSLIKRAGFTRTQAQTGRRHPHPALRFSRHFEYARIIPPLCNLLILFKQTLLFYQRVPIDNEFARCFQPL